MTQAAFTPGPWEAGRAEYPDNTGGYDFGISADRKIIAEAFAHVGYADDDRTAYERAPVEANARLIAAAPELYEALEGLIGFAESTEAKALIGDEGCLWPMEFARAALAKARGEAA